MTKYRGRSARIAQACPNAILALGSNQGDRRVALDRAIELLTHHGNHVEGKSRLYRTRPLPGSTGSWFLNAAVSLRTTMRPSQLLDLCQSIERAMGRVRRGHWGPRIIDLDIIFYDRLYIKTSSLSIPHSYWKDRDFVIAPLIDLNFAPSNCSCAGSTRRLRQLLAQAERTIESAGSWS